MSDQYDETFLHAQKICSMGCDLVQFVPEQSGSSNCCSSSEADVMDAGVAVENFISTGRTGRRNAMADISDPRVGTVSTSGIDFSFDKLSVSEPKSQAESGQASSSSQPPGDTGQQPKS